MYLLWIRGDYCIYWWVDENVTRGSQESIFALPLRPMVHYSLSQSLNLCAGQDQREEWELDSLHVQNPLLRAVL